MPQREPWKTVILVAIFTVLFFALCGVVSVFGVVSGVFPDTLASRTIEERYTEEQEATATTERHLTQTAHSVTVPPDEQMQTSEPSPSPTSTIIPTASPTQ